MRFNDFRDHANTNTSFSTSTTFGKCLESHPPLVLPKGQTIYGGSCISPTVKDCDIYVGFDHGMRPSQRSWPWKKGEEFLFHITDGSIPTQPEEFKKLIAWSLKRLDEGKRIHCGCIGGHGRTGLYLCALVIEQDPTIKDPIQWVRDRYCTKAVETNSQVDFLVEHYGAKKVAPRPPRWMQGKNARKSTSFGKEYDGWETDPDFSDNPTITGIKPKKPKKRAARKAPRSLESIKAGVPRALAPIFVDPFPSDTSVW